MGKKEHAVVELYSTCFLLALVVIFFTAISSVFLSTPQSSSGSIVNIAARMVDNNVILEHQGGDEISLNANIGLFFNNNQVQIRAYDYVDNETREDGLWGFSEQVVYHIY